MTAAIAVRRAAGQHAAIGGEFAIYVHWPFCKAKCPYCDFNSHVRPHGVDAKAFADGLCRELETFADLAPGRTVNSIFFGGGTPSLMPAGAVATVLDRAARLWPLAGDCEITLEANPTSAEAENFAGYRSAGVNRLSLGIQSLNAKDLKFLGRQHSPDEALRAFEMAADMFERTSFDLIYARPGQSIADWHDELARALEYQRGHMSLYQLTIEPDTAFFALHAAGKLAMPDEDTAAALYDVTCEMTARAGLAAYEVSNYAAPGHECVHNTIYWRYGEYAGVGPGAHSRIAGDGQTRLAMATERDPQSWLDLVARTGSGMTVREDIGLDAQGDEYVLMGLRLARGISLEVLAQRFGRTIGREKIAALCADGLVNFDEPGGHIAATAKGRKLLNSVIVELMSD